MDQTCVLNKAPDSVSRLIAPRSIAVVGASSNATKRGYQIIESLLRNGYSHPIYPVSPRGGTILGIPVLETIEALPLDIDLVVVARPAAEVTGILRACCRRRIAGAVVLASGFKESGPDGALLQEALQEFLATHPIRMIGPNTSGMINFSHGVDLVGLKEQYPAGPVSAITQSGNMLLSLLADSQRHGTPGLNVYAGLGNQADVNIAELLEAFSTAAATKAIAIHAEGFPDGRQLLVSSAEASRRRPVVLLRGGRSEAGRHTALSHTGSVSGTDQVASGLFRQVGVTQVDRSDELAIVAGALATLPLPAANRGVVVLSDGGGHATLAVDRLTGLGVRLSELSSTTREALRHHLGATAAVNNPIDVASAGDASPRLFAQCAELLQRDPDVGAILVVGLLGGYHLRFDPRDEPSETEACADIGRTAHTRGFPVVVHSCYEHKRPVAHQRLREYGIPVLGSIDHAASCVHALVQRSHWLATESERTGASALQTGSRRHQGTSAAILLEHKARKALEEHGIDLGPWSFADSATQAHEQVLRFGARCAFKVVADGVTHKSDVGGVRLNINAHQAADTWTAIVHAVRQADPDCMVRGVVIAPMIDPGTELLLGITMDPQFGPMIAFGAGGVTVNAMQDLAFRALPLTLLEAREMILETRISRILFGYRNLPSIGLQELAQFVVDMGTAALNIEGLVDLEFNPVILNGSGLHIADVRLISAL